MFTNKKLTSFADNLSGFLDNTSDLLFIKDPESAFVATSRGLCDLIKMDKKNTALSGRTPTAYKLDHYDASLKLTPREAQCLFLTIRGKSAKEMSLALGISQRTVEVYISNLKGKLGVFSRSQLIASAIDRGLLEIIPKGEMLTQLCQALGN